MTVFAQIKSIYFLVFTELRSTFECNKQSYLHVFVHILKTTETILIKQLWDNQKIFKVGSKIKIQRVHNQSFPSFWPIAANYNDKIKSFFSPDKNYLINDEALNNLKNLLLKTLNGWQKFTLIKMNYWIWDNIPYCR